LCVIGRVRHTCRNDCISRQLKYAHVWAAVILLQTRRPPKPTLFPYTTLFRSLHRAARSPTSRGARAFRPTSTPLAPGIRPGLSGDRKSTRLNSSHSQISYAVFCLKKKNVDIFETLLHPTKPPPAVYTILPFSV